VETAAPCYPRSCMAAGSDLGLGGPVRAEAAGRDGCAGSSSSDGLQQSWLSVGMGGASSLEPMLVGGEASGDRHPSSSTVRPVSLLSSLWW
jgi:hypothetical protein